MALLRKPSSGRNTPFDDDQWIPGGGNLPGAPAPAPDLGGIDVSGNIPESGRGGESPRERGGGGDTSGGAAPPRPHSPAPQAGSGALPPSGQGGGLGPFSPMPSAPGVSLAKPRGMGSLYGSAGGLQGGGLGLPFDPVSNQKSPDIGGLLELLKRGGGGAF